MKILNTKRVYAYLVWLNSNIKPSEYSTAEEMKVMVGEIRPMFAELCEEFRGTQDKVEGIQRRLVLEEITTENAQREVNEINRGIQKLELTIGQEPVEIKFENSQFNTLFSYFSRLGKGWFGSAENFMEFEKDINKTNQQSKE